MDQPPRFDDHLHEAVQRLILNYLVEHEDDPIPLTPGVLRMTALEDGTWSGRRCDSNGTSCTSASGAPKRAREDEERSPAWCSEV
ncbi:hypothetical protein BD413DRAFT_35061 [Trametes elegans]|nr:hypothetical protein BD413DRAFT_35061 [Trametes elegans]